jgi:hypothetical protein
MTSDRILGNQLEDKCGSAPASGEEETSAGEDGLTCSGKAVRQMCKAAMQKELDCTTPNKLTAGIETCGSCTTEWTDKSGCSAKCVLISGTFGESSVPQLCSDEADAKKEDGSPKHAALKELIGEWEMGHGGSDKARKAAAELGTDVDDSETTHLPASVEQDGGLGNLEPTEGGAGSSSDAPYDVNSEEDFPSLGGGSAKTGSKTPTWGPDSRTGVQVVNGDPAPSGEETTNDNAGDITDPEESAPENAPTDTEAPATLPAKKVWQNLMRNEKEAMKDTSFCGPWCKPWPTGNKKGCAPFGGSNKHHEKYCHKVCVDPSMCRGGSAAARFQATKTMLRHNHN